MTQATVNNEFSESIEKNNRRRYWISLSVFLLMFFLRDVGGISIRPLFFLIANTILFIFFDKEESIAFLIAMPLLNTGFQYVFAIGIGVVIYVIKNFNDICITKYAISVLLIFAWELLHIIIPPFGVYDYIKYITPFFVYIVVICLNDTEINTRLVIFTFLAVLIFLLTTVFLTTLMHFQFSLSTMWSKGFRLGFTVNKEVQYMLSGNPNDLGFYCNLGIGGLLLLLANEERTKVRIIFYILSFIIALFGFITLSKTYIVVLAFTVLYWFWVTSEKTIPKKLFNILLAILLLLGIILIIRAISPILFKSFLARFTDEDLTTGRNDLFVQYTKFIFSDIDIFIFGIGAQSYYEKVVRMSTIIIDNVSHNGIQEIFLTWGLIGFIIVLFLFFSYFLSAKRRGAKINVKNIMPFLIIILRIQSGHFSTAPLVIIMLAFAYCCLFVKENKNYELQE